MFGFSSFEPKRRPEVTRSRAIVPATAAVALIAAFLASCRDKSPLAPVEEESLSLEVAAERGVQERPQVVPGQYIITFRDQAQLPPGIVRQLSEQYGLAARHTFENV